MNDSCLLDIYGFRAMITCASPVVLSGIREDFAFFEVDAASESNEDSTRVELFEDDPPYDQVPDASATVFTPRNVSFRSGDVTYLDYSGRALGIHDREHGVFRIFSRDADLLYEAAYLFLLSQSGEFFDAHHRFRVHALAVSIENRAALVLLPMGGGKSTLGSELLRYPDIQLLSDDSPLIDSTGKVWAFPLRLGLLPGSEGTIAPEKLRMIRRMEFGPKLLVNHCYFADRVVPHADPCLLFLGTRSLRNTCEITPASRFAALRAMFSNCVIGLGLFQGMEFVFERGWWEVLRKTVAAIARLRASLRLIARSKVYHLFLGRDLEQNGRVVVEHLRSRARKTSVKSS
jgi:hypothetical protein